MEIILLGLSHKTSPVESREKLLVPLDRLPEFLQGLISQPPIQEAFAVFTCNRAEIMAVTEPDPVDLKNIITNFWSEFLGIPRSEFERFLYYFRHRDSIRHLFRVSSSLDSMILGEPQILGQIKEAYAVAAQAKATRLVLNRLLHRAFAVAKRVRTETGVAASAVSVAYAAVELARKIFSDLKERRALLIGAGDMAELALKHLHGQGLQHIIVTNRTYARAVQTAENFQAQAAPLKELPRLIAETDIIISSTGAPRYLITHAMMGEIMEERRRRPLFIIDIAVPRDVDPAIDALDNVYRYDIDDLQGVVESNVDERHREAEKAEIIVNEEVSRFYQWLKTLEVTPAIVDLKNKLESMRVKELQKTFQHLKDLTSDEKLALEQMSEALISKILHYPVTTLKERHLQGSAAQYVDALRVLFHLGEEDEGD